MAQKMDQRIDYVLAQDLPDFTFVQRAAEYSKATLNVLATPAQMHDAAFDMYGRAAVPDGYGPARRYAVATVSAGGCLALVRTSRSSGGKNGSWLRFHTRLSDLRMERADTAIDNDRRRRLEEAGLILDPDATVDPEWLICNTGKSVI